MRCGIPIAALLAGGCAGAPITDGTQALEIRATAWLPYDGPGDSFKVMREVEGVGCTLCNDKGTWTVETPGIVQVARSAVPLEIDCAKEGYGSKRERLACLSQAQDWSTHERVGVALAVVTLPLAIAAAPVAPHLAIQAAGQGLLTAGHVALGRGGRDWTSCYGHGVAVLLEPQPVAAR
jgi:hypothetical protein